MFPQQDIEFAGEFETHITVNLKSIDEIKPLQKWGTERGFKFLHILLDRGLTASQPMLTRRGAGNFKDELKIAVDSCQKMQTEGFSAVRIKIETPPWNQGVPQSNLEAKDLPDDRYFEHHIKLLLEPSADLAILTTIAEQHAARLSRNALQTNSDGNREQFITQRCKFVGHLEAKQRLQKLLEEIAPLGYQVIGVEAEFVVYDSNLTVDEGWILNL
jgi:hypothetical protein